MLLFTAVTALLGLSVLQADVAPEPDTRIGSVERFDAPGGGGFSIDQVVRERGLQSWQAVGADINLGYLQEPVWYRIRLRNSSEDVLERFLEVGYPLLDHIETHHVASGEIVDSFVTGDREPHGSRPLDYRTFVFPLTLEPIAAQEVYLRVQTSGSHQVPLKLWQPEAFNQKDRRDMTMRGMFYGMLLIMAVFNLILWRAFRDRSFLYFVGVQLVLLVSMASLHGVAFQYLFPDAPRLHELIILTGVPLSVMFFSLFCLEFLELRKRSRTSAWLAIGCAWICGLAAIGGLVLSYGLSTRISVNLTAVVCLLILTVGVVLAIGGSRQARHFVTGWFVLLLGVVGHILTLNGVLSSDFLMSYAMESGAVLASLVFSFALGDRFQREHRARTDEQHARIQAMDERERVERRMLDQARRHAVTRMPNRSALEQRLNQVLGEPGQRGERLGLVVFKLRGFDDINKTLGHENADGLLRQVASRLDQLVLALDDHLPIEHSESQQHAVGHLDGYTFAFLLRLRPGQDPTSIMCDLADYARKPFEYMGLRLGVDITGGCAVCPDDSADASTLLRHAFVAIDQAIKDIRGMAVYSDRNNSYNPRRLTLMTELRRAIEDDELSLNFQPQLRLSNGRVDSVEALLRWTHPEHGVVPPDEFIPLAERAGLMRPLTEWVLRHALAFAQQAERAGHPLMVAVNVSPISLRDPDFASRVLNLLERCRAAPELLTLEMTESAAMTDPEQTYRQLAQLHKAGIKLSIDDFGTGHSSLAWLSKLPVQEIKIDRSFVQTMLDNAGNDTIVRTTIDMCHALGFEVVAEGVESERILERLSELGADRIQGYHLLKAEPEEIFMQWLGTFSEPEPRDRLRLIDLDSARHQSRKR